MEKARYTDPKATDYMTETLITRRDKVLATWLNQVNPVVDVTLDGTGALTFATPPSTRSGDAGRELRDPLVPAGQRP